MGHFYNFVDQMRLYEMGLDEMGINCCILQYFLDAQWRMGIQGTLVAASPASSPMSGQFSKCWMKESTSWKISCPNSILFFFTSTLKCFTECWHLGMKNKSRTTLKESAIAHPASWITVDDLKALSWTNLSSELHNWTSMVATIQIRCTRCTTSVYQPSVIKAPNMDGFSR